jgi:hypothetical protein
MTNSTLFEPAAAEEIVSRLDKLGPTSQPQWGKMDAAQMMAHCAIPFEVYFGEKKMKRSLLGILFGRVAKKQLFGDKPWKKNMPTSPVFKVAEEKNFEAERARLRNIINRFATEGYAVTQSKHPFFGHLSSQEWAMLGYRHLDHHLKQFGA